ncbi:MAG: choice-of-anchor I family protein [Sulfurimonas sp.]|nr:choice-of-anchor I family protein [Sulfurimonas sp.]
MYKYITMTSVLSLSAAMILGISGCSSTDEESNTGVSYLGSVLDSGSFFPYTVMDNTILDGTKTDGTKIEVRNGGFGSAAAADPKNINRFYALTDRGPNAVYTGLDGKGILFPTPEYTPRIGHFEIQSDGTIKKLDEILFKDRDGKNISGLPNSSLLGATGEIPYDKDGVTIKNSDGSIKTDDYGLDSEGLAVMQDGTFWVSDEYGPHIVHLDATGKELERINPFIADTRNKWVLPEEFKYRRANRGMEGIAITPDQKTLVGIMQSTMALPSSSVQKSSITRIVTIDIETGKVGQYLYKQDKNENSNSEIVALSNDSFLVIERDGSFSRDTATGQKHIYKITLSSGTNLEEVTLENGRAQDAALGLTIDGKTLEETVINASGNWDTLAMNGIYPVAKSLVVDMIKENNYMHDKMEGLIVFNESTLGILNDDDFATWSTAGVLEQKYLDTEKTKVDMNTLYVVNDLNLSAIDNSQPVMPLTKLGSYATNKEAGSEIVAYDKTSKRMFSTNGTENKIDIIDIEDVKNPTLVSQIDLSSYGTGVNSVAAHDGKIAVAVEVKSADGLKTNSQGKVVFFDKDGTFEKSVIVGYLPDMVTFNEDGLKVIVANEGEPNGDYSVDPIGSIGVITVSNGSYVDINFSGVSLTDAIDTTPVRLGETPSNDQAKDIEPEYIAVKGNYAYVTLQENNAMAKVNLTNNTLEYVKSFGAKSWEASSGNTIDIEEEGAINMKSYTALFGLYMPDSIVAYETNAATYLVTANEGDGREYPVSDINSSLKTGDVLTDEKKISKLTLDSSIASEYVNENDLKVVIDMGDIDKDGDYDKLYSYGARSFSIWDANGTQIFDSGDEIEKKVALYESALFNQDNGAIDGRSGNKGAEPEALAIGYINGKTVAFVGLERQNAIVMYDITTPNKAKFLAYIKTGNEGDISAEGMKFIPASQSPNGKNLLLVSYEISGSAVVYEIKNL